MGLEKVNNLIHKHNYNWNDKIRFIILNLSAALFFLFPVYPPAVQSISFGFFIISQLAFNFKLISAQIKSMRLWLIFLGLGGFYLLSMLSILWSSNFSSYLWELSPNISYILVLFVSLFCIPFNKKHRDISIGIFVCSVLLYMLNWQDYFNNGLACYNSKELREHSIYELFVCMKNIYWDVNPNYFNHYTYVSFVLNLSSIACILLLKNHRKLILLVLAIIIIIFNVAIISILKSKINQAFSGVIVFYLFYILIEKLVANKYISLIILIFTLGFLFSFNIDQLNNLRKVKLFEKENVIDGGSNALIDHMRYEQYLFALKLSEKNRLFGIGLGDVQPELSKCFSQRDDLMYWHGLQKLNTHSQFVHYFLATGYAGLMLFSFFFCTLFYLAFHTKNVLLFLSAVLIGSNCLFENILSRTWGVYTISVALLYFLPETLTKK